MNQSKPDPVALLIAQETPFPYAYCKYVLDAWRGDETAARSALQLSAAERQAAWTPRDFETSNGNDD